MLKSELGELAHALRPAPPPPRPRKKKDPKPKPIHYLQGLRIAVDVAVSNRTVAFLKKMGFEIVCQAEHGEPDEQWVQRAYQREVDVVVTDDLQIHGWGRQYGFLVVPSWARNERGGERLYAAIVAAMDDELDRTP